MIDRDITEYIVTDVYQCKRPSDIPKSEECLTCTGRQPNLRCKWLEIIEKTTRV